MEILIFIFYLFLVSFLLIKIPFFKNSGINSLALIGLFWLKVLAGIGYALFYRLPKYYSGSDTWRFYRLSLTETKWLLSDPLAFAKDLFVYGYQKPGNIFISENSYWNDLKSNVPVKIMAVMNVGTRNSYYTNVILFNFLFLFGLIAIFKLFAQLYPRKNIFIITGLFLLPSTLFWCSGIHKDGLILSASGLLIYCFYMGLSLRFSAKYVFCIFSCCLLIFSLRNYVLFAFIPALTAWYISQKAYDRSLLVFSVIYVAGIIIFFSLSHFIPAINLPNYLVMRQQEFMQLKGNSIVQLPELLPTLRGFIKFLPFALDMAFLRPHFSELRNLSYLPAATEIVLFLSVMILAFFSRKTVKTLPPFLYFLFFFSISVLLICGYTIPFSGAIVRYRSVILPFIITPLLCTQQFIKF